jgi:hypothetical protein
MEVQHHINAGFWPRGEHVSLEDRNGQRYVQCSLALDRDYELAAAYTYAPHTAFMNLMSDEDVAQFVSSWGPLRLSDAERATGLSMMRLDAFWAFQRRFAAFGKLLESFGRAAQERVRLREYLAISEEESKVRGLGSPSSQTVFVATWLQTDRLAQQLAPKAYGTDIFDQLISPWLEKASPESARGVIAHLVENASFAPPAYLKAEWKRRRPRITATLGLENLEDALEWMIWNSYWLESPLMFCRECHKAFRPETAHRRKYDSPECAHRATARRWRRKDLRQKKLSTRKEK